MFLKTEKSAFDWAYLFKTLNSTQTFILDDSKRSLPKNIYSALQYEKQLKF